MKAKYIFTKYGYKRNNIILNDIVPENTLDYDVADIFIVDLYSSDGETKCFEAENLEEALYFANRYFQACISPKNIDISYECWIKLTDLATVLNDPIMLTIRNKNLYDQNLPYIPAPIKIDTCFGTFKNKRYRKFYQKYEKRNRYGYASPVFNYNTVYDRM